MEKTTVVDQSICYPTPAKLQPWVAFSRKENIPSQFKNDAVPTESKDVKARFELYAGSAGEVNRDIEYDTGSAGEANLGH
jgi:hypothetical protein